MKMRAKLVAGLLFAAVILTSCANDITSDEDATVTAEPSVTAPLTFSEEDSKTEPTESAANIICNGDTVSVDGTGASFKDGTITVTSAGEYIFSGTLNGSIVVDADKQTVHLIFSGISITAENTAPVNVRDAEKVIMTLTDGTENSLSDSGSYTYDDTEKQEPSSAVFSKSDLTLNGNGTLRIDTDFNDGITSKDVLRIAGGNYEIDSADDGIIGRDAILIDGGNFNITSGGDGLKTTNDEDTSLGYILIENGTFSIDASADGIQAETEITLNGGVFNITTGGGSANASYSDNGQFNNGWGNWPGGGHGMRMSYSYTDTSSENSSDSAKALKAGTNISINGGDIQIDSSDDSIHSKGSVAITHGTVSASSGDDGIHADSALIISGGDVTVSKSYEGLEASDIMISGGNINVSATDDGINGAGGNDSSAMQGRPGQNSFSSGTATLSITGGEINVNSVGDGIDINGSADISGGTVYVYGPTDSGNGTLDYDVAFETNGGTLIALGSAGMLQGTSGGEQCSAAITFFDISAGTVLTLKDSKGNEIISVTAEKQCSSIVFSSPDIAVGETYTLYADGTELTSYTQSQATVTASGGMSGKKPGGMPGGMGGGMFR